VLSATILPIENFPQTLIDRVIWFNDARNTPDWQRRRDRRKRILEVVAEVYFALLVPEEYTPLKEMTCNCKRSNPRRAERAACERVWGSRSPDQHPRCRMD
jgi:hypothetical protein